MMIIRLVATANFLDVQRIVSDIDANLEGAEIRGYWSGDTEEEKIEARASEYVDEGEEDDE